MSLKDYHDKRAHQETVRASACAEETWAALHRQLAHLHTARSGWICFVEAMTTKLEKE
jgi:hypothetical protein